MNYHLVSLQSSPLLFSPCKRRPRLSLTHNKHMSRFPSVSISFSSSLSLAGLALHLSWALFNFTICVNVIKISFVKAPKSPPGQGESHSVALVDHRERVRERDDVRVVASAAAPRYSRPHYTLFCILCNGKSPSREAENPSIQRGKLKRAAAAGAAAAAAALPLCALLMFVYLLPSLHARQA